MDEVEDFKIGWQTENTAEASFHQILKLTNTLVVLNVI